MIEDLSGPGPNGSAWEIVDGGSTEEDLATLDLTNLVVGRVIAGLQVVRKRTLRGVVTHEGHRLVRVLIAFRASFSPPRPE